MKVWSSNKHMNDLPFQMMNLFLTLKLGNLNSKRCLGKIQTVCFSKHYNAVNGGQLGFIRARQ